MIHHSSTVKRPPGFGPTIAALLGICVYGFGTYMAYGLWQLLISDFQDLEEELGALIVTVFIVLFLYGLAIIGSILVIVGQIWKQRKLIVFISLLGYLGTVVPILLITLAGMQDGGVNVQFIVTWSAMVLMLFMHLNGLVHQFDPKTDGPA